MQGAVGLISGFTSSGGNGSGPSTPSYGQISKVAGVGDGPTPGLNTYTNAAILGATDMNVIVVNNANEVSPGDFTFDGTTITRPNNVWVAGDTLVASFKPA